MSDRTTSRAAEVLDQSFAEGLAEISLEELRRRRDEALAEREFQSYLRRLVQTRIDILRDEQARRVEGGDPQPLVERLASALSEGGPKGTSRGEALVVSVSSEDMAEAQLQADAITRIGDADPRSMSDEDLAAAVAVLEEAERSVSADRVAIFHVHDRLQDELKRRYRDDPSLIAREF